jgi:hypothetical protein
MVKMKHSMEQDQRITRELEKYRLAPPSPDLHDRVLRSAGEAWVSSNAELPWLDRWMRACRAFRQEILAFASTVMLILGVVMQLAGGQSVLADSIERLKAIHAVSGHLHSAISMDCTVLKPSAGHENSRYRVRWNTAGVTRVDVDSTGGKDQTLWISMGTISVANHENGTVRSMAITTVPSEWQPPMEFLTPTTLAQHMTERYGLMQSERQDRANPHEFLLVGQEDQQVIEIAVDAKTYLPTTLKKYSPHSARTGEERGCLEVVRFQWNKPIPQELLVPGSSAVKRQAN